MKKMISTIILTILLSIIIIPIISYAGLRKEVNVEASRRPLGSSDREEIEAPNDPIAR